MATANTSIDVTELSFDPNRESLKAFLKAKSKLKDYNYEGSTLSILLDILAYANYQSGFYANMTTNEGFLDTAVLRDSVVSRAKALSYTPRSAKSARATLRVTVVPNDTPDFVTIRKGTKFEAILDSQRYLFEVEADTIIAPTDGVFIGDVTIAQGITVTERYPVSGDAPHRFVLLNADIDTDSLLVQVRPSADSTQSTTYSRAYDITDVRTEDTSYFLEGDRDNRFAIQFGDDVIGRALQPGEVVVVSYRVTEGSLVNGVGTFAALNDMGGYNAFSFRTIARATGGQDIQTTESIRYHAPRFWEMQNRLVTTPDYETFIKANHSDIQALAVWGGDENVPPIYGKVFISAKPFNGFTLPQYKKDAIFASCENFNVQSIEPVIVDPTFLYVVPSVRAFFDPTVTTLTAGSIHSKVAQALIAFEENKLGLFKQRFRSAEFVTYLQAADPSITNVEVDTTLQKRFTPTLNARFTYTIKFNQAIDHPVDGNPAAVVASSGFTLPAYSQTMYLDDDGSGRIRVFYRNAAGDKIFVDRSAGTIDYDTGEIKIRNFSPSSYVGSEMKIAVVPRYQSYLPINNQIILLADATVAVWRENARREESAAYIGSVTTQGTTETLLERAIAS